MLHNLIDSRRMNDHEVDLVAASSTYETASSLTRSSTVIQRDNGIEARLRYTDNTHTVVGLNVLVDTSHIVLNGADDLGTKTSIHLLDTELLHSFLNMTHTVYLLSQFRNRELS